MTASVVVIAMAVSVVLYKLVDIFPVLNLIIIYKNNTAVVENSCVKFTFV